ncbi:MAG TPA: hypothetical protein VFD73_21300 [Gemmatimonadales bacterium]|nr:hypothetical protein [Gemmatimonadales bacterium]
MLRDPDLEDVPYLDSLDQLELVLLRSFCRRQVGGFELIILDSPARKAYPEPSRAKFCVGGNAA